ncbi:hypothetical protein NHX12_008012 [Muraenolepis orangiensis]|uniref:Uncharacterized protein n=1 Tax=Muraenolepis orangiensis TaxID=630683 RepID=A0A9Q0DJZ1_9TELE|nr:hypothetical protein NHX12_008012 [Muraenolepis orangiensis]
MPLLKRWRWASTGEAAAGGLHPAAEAPGGAAGAGRHSHRRPQQRQAARGPLSHRLAQEAALVARGCSHIRICPECRHLQGLKMRPPGGPLHSSTHSDDSLEWDKTTNSSEPE